MGQTLPRSWWMLALAALVGALVALALSQSGGTGQAGAQAGAVQLTREQLLINQRISQAAVRRSNAALDRLPRWAVVLADGRLVRGSGVQSVNRTGLGTYLVRFDRDLTGCAFTATQIQPDPALIGNVGLQVGGSDLDQLEVNTTSAAGAAADRNFTAQVTC